MKCKKYIAIERNGKKTRNLTEKKSWNIAAFVNFCQLS